MKKKKSKFKWCMESVVKLILKYLQLAIITTQRVCRHWCKCTCHSGPPSKWSPCCRQLTRPTCWYSVTNWHSTQHYWIHSRQLISRCLGHCCSSHWDLKTRWLLYHPVIRTKTLNNYSSSLDYYHGLHTWEQLAIFVFEWMIFCDHSTSLTHSLCPVSVWSSTQCPFWSSRQIFTTLSHPPEAILFELKPFDIGFSSCGNAGAQLTEVQPVYH